MTIVKSRQLFLWMLLVLTCLFVQNVRAMEFPEIKANQLKSKMEAGEKLMLVNSLSDIEFNAEHIPDSINIPLIHIMRTTKLPKEQDHLIVTYCLGPE